MNPNNILNHDIIRSQIVNGLACLPFAKEGYYLFYQKCKLIESLLLKGLTQHEIYRILYEHKTQAHVFTQALNSKYYIIETYKAVADGAIYATSNCNSPQTDLAVQFYSDGSVIIKLIECKSKYMLKDTTDVQILQDVDKYIIKGNNDILMYDTSILNPDDASKMAEIIEKILPSSFREAHIVIVENNPFLQNPELVNKLLLDPILMEETIRLLS